MTHLLSQTPSRGELYSSAAGDFTVTVNAGGKTVTISNPGFALTPNAIQVAQLWTVSGSTYSKQDIPLDTVSIAGFIITFDELGANFTGTEIVEIIILGPKKTVTEANSGSIKTAVEQAQTIFTAIRDTAGIKKITDDVEVVQPDAAALLNTEVNSGDIKTAVEALVAALFSDDSAFTAGTDKGLLALAANTSDEVDSGDLGALKMTSFRELVIAGFSALINAVRVNEINPANQWFITETLVEEENITANTENYAYLEMNGFSCFSLQGITDGDTPTDILTVTFQVTNQDDGTALADCEWTEATEDFADVESFVDEDFILIADVKSPVRAVRIKYVTSDTGGDDTDLTVYSKKIY